MIPVKFPESNSVLGASQDEYEPLPAHRFPDGRVAMCFRLSPAELAEIARTRTLTELQGMISSLRIANEMIANHHKARFGIK